MTLRCVSCGKRVENESCWIKFPCPDCGKDDIVRCERCRKIVNKYKCKKCGFEGP